MTSSRSPSGLCGITYGVAVDEIRLLRGDVREHGLERRQVPVNVAKDGHPH
jgi:hypothetical protein